MTKSALQTLMLSVTIIVAVACEERGKISIDNTPAEGTTEQLIFVATTRQASTKPNEFNSLRTSTVSLARYDVSIPPSHKSGRIEWPKGTPDPATDFVTTNVVPFTSTAQFTSAINRENRSTPSANEVVVYIHGYNINFSEGLYRWAQVTADTGFPGVAVHYSWPSSETLLQYTRDRDSVLFARDGLQSLLEHLAATNAKRILVVAHSIGSSLLMETLRQMAIGSQKDVFNKLGGVVLISPDIDINLFETQIRRLEPIPQPFVIFGGEQDKALKVSAFLTRFDSRVGQLTKKDQAVLARYGIDMIDVSDVKDGDGKLGHTIAITSPIILSILQKLSVQQETQNHVDAVRFKELIDSATR